MINNIPNEIMKNTGASIVDTGIKIYETSDYDIFKKMDGNRGVSIERKNKIRNSLNAVGYITNPITVNEKMEIGDGQARFEVFKERNMSIQFVIHEGMTLNDCIALNVNQKTWTLRDYVEAYSVQGKETYTWLLEMDNKYPKISLNDICSLAHSKGLRLGGHGSSTRDIKNGKMSLDKKEREYVEQVIKYISGYTDTLNTMKGRKCIMYNSIIYCYGRLSQIYPNFDAERLKRKFNEAVPAPVNSYDMEGCIQTLEDLYNSHLRKQDLRLSFLARYLDDKHNSMYTEESENE